MANPRLRTIEMRTIHSVFDALYEALQPRPADLFQSDEQKMEWLHTKLEPESFAEKWYNELDATYKRSLDALDPEFKNAFPGGWQLWTDDLTRVAIYERIDFDKEGMMGQDEFGNTGYRIWATAHLKHCGTPSTEAWRIPIEETRTKALRRRILTALPATLRPVLRLANGRMPKTMPELLERIRDADLTELVAATPNLPVTSSKGSSGTHDVAFFTSSAGGSASSRAPRSNQMHDLVPEVPPEPQSYWIDIFPIDDSLPAFPECAPEPQSQWIDLQPIDHANNIPESAPEPQSQWIDLVPIDECTCGTFNAAPEPQSHWIDLVPIDECTCGTFNAAPEPQSHWIDLYPQLDGSNIPESTPESASVFLDLYPVNNIGSPIPDVQADVTEITTDLQSSGYHDADTRGGQPDAPYGTTR
ncbi:hypothetical protein FIBSPDRAFT_1039685 [Athelia psychrophila]|uniref:Uncharacterized protein n=1 Tax=Athelia psychrophila TaxID=1759441 RepID=A0A166RGY5_9AGAM|nr:hypothetical protein FIBSPDRAFT_1039685 [Fibularhizoctonia sp. CBS 109695]